MIKLSISYMQLQVTIAELNDSKLIGSSVYNVVILCGVGVAVSATISDRPSILYIFLSCIVLFCTTITLVVIFVPKVSILASALWAKLVVIWLC